MAVDYDKVIKIIKVTKGEIDIDNGTVFHCICITCLTIPILDRVSWLELISISMLLFINQRELIFESN